MAKIFNKSCLFFLLLNTAGVIAMQHFSYVTITNKCSWPITIFYNVSDSGSTGGHKSYITQLNINAGESKQRLLQPGEDDKIGLWIADEENNSAELRIPRSYNELIVSAPTANKNLSVTFVPQA